MQHPVADALPLAGLEIELLYPLLSDNIDLGVPVPVKEFADIRKRHFVVSVIVYLSFVGLVVVALAEELSSAHATRYQNLILIFAILLAVRAQREADQVADMIDWIALYLNPLEVPHLLVAESTRTAMAAVVVHTIGGIGVGCVSRGHRTMVQTRLRFQGSRTRCFQTIRAHRLGDAWANDFTSMRQPLEPLAMKLNFAHFGSILVLLVILGVVHFDVVARNIIDCFEIPAHFHDHLFFEILCLVSAEHVDVAILKDARCRMIAAFVELRVQLKPAIFVDIVAFHIPLALLELLKLDERLVSAASDGIDVSIAPLRISKVRPARIHEFAFLQSCPPRHVFIVLIRVGAAHYENSEATIGYYCFVPAGLHGR